MRTREWCMNILEYSVADMQPRLNLCWCAGLSLLARCMHAASQPFVNSAAAVLAAISGTPLGPSKLEVCIDGSRKRCACLYNFVRDRHA
jgi:hypothetical protein